MQHPGKKQQQDSADGNNPRRKRQCLFLNTGQRLQQTDSQSDQQTGQHSGTGQPHSCREQIPSDFGDFDCIHEAGFERVDWIEFGNIKRIEAGFADGNLLMLILVVRATWFEVVPY